MTKRTPKTTKPEPTARRNDIARLMDVLAMELDKHDEQAKADPTNWGITGNLGKVRSDLMDTVAFLSGMDREDIERFLAE
ncbi:MAG: hypothetical protein HBSAPP03_15440 [Phycisphaerae bacterium]|jgi:hypothetical protein|nr:MAG: hypothetical protein HBSAPP03_15440 [Phycisphaerae bacterium]